MWEEEVKQKKTAEALIGIKIEEFKNCFEQWESLDRCIEMESTLKVTEV